MAVTNSYIFSFHAALFYHSLVLFFFCYSNKLCTYVDAAAAIPYHYDIEIDMLMPEPTCSASTTDPARRSHLQISHRYGPCSRRGQHEKSPSSRELFLKDESRVRSINNAQTLDPYVTDNKLHAGVPISSISEGAGIFTTTVGIGTPRSYFDLIFDTGSDLTWIQCKSCDTSPACLIENNLEKNHRPLFDPSNSKTYSKGSCISGSDNRPIITYEDHTYAFYHYGCDTLSLPPSDVFPKFQFGCGQGNSDNFSDVDGMLGLGQGQGSTITQTASKLGKVFSYCLPPVKSSKGHLSFGEKAKAIAAASSLKFTPLERTSKYYFLTLNGITVANEKLDISPSVFESPGTVIDSGTIITRLPPSAYSALRVAFNKSMSSRYPHAPSLESFLDTCYYLTGYKNVVIPEIVFHFGGGTDVKLHYSGIVWKDKDRICLAFAQTKDPSDDYTIIGNKLQQTLEVFYDLGRRKVGFGTNGCSK